MLTVLKAIYNQLYEVITLTQKRIPKMMSLFAQISVLGAWLSSNKTDSILYNHSTLKYCQTIMVLYMKKCLYGNGCDCAKHNYMANFKEGQIIFKIKFLNLIAQASLSYFLEISELLGAEECFSFFSLLFVLSVMLPLF